jgi:anti-sigma factor RsiW
MMSSDSSSVCGRAEALRDYAFDELPPDERRAVEQHLAVCGDCVQELDQLRLTTAALRVLPDREIPQRIAFVSDRVFAPSALSRFWSSASQLGFASACVLAVAIVVSAWHFSAGSRPPEIRTVVQTASVSQQQIDEAVAKAVAQVRTEDARMIEAAIRTSEQTRDREYRNQIIGMQESYDLLRRRFNMSYTSMASRDGAGQ